MSRVIITTLIVSLLVFVLLQDKSKPAEIVRSYDAVKDVTTVQTSPQELSGPKDRYHSVTFSVSYAYAGKGAGNPNDVDLELVSVVKARELNPDLYVVFVIDGQEVHFSSNRNAIRNPVRGKPWIGERMVFGLSREKYVKLIAAKKLSVKLGDANFDFSRDQIALLLRVMVFTH